MPPLAEATRERVSALPNQELVAYHRRLHMLWGSGKKDDETRRAHSNTVAEMKSRQMNHHHRSGLDDGVWTEPITKEQYDRTYFENQHVIDPAFVREMAAILEHVEGPSVVVVGVGAGRELDVLGHLGFSNLLGTDTAAAAREMCSERGHRVFDYDARELPLHDGSFASVMSMHVLEHIPDFADALAESVRVAGRRAIHLVPLGHTDDPSHHHQFPTLDDFRVAVQNSGVLDRCSHSFRRPTPNSALLVVDKDVPVPTPVIAHLDTFTVVPEFISLAGGSVKRSDPTDIDLVVRAMDRMPSLEVAVRNLLPRDEMRDRLHFVYNRQGPHDDAIPLFDLVARFNPQALRLIEKAAALQPLQVFTPVKTGSAYSSGEFAAIDAAWSEWAKPLVDKGKTIDVEEKFNGWRLVLEVDRQGQTLIFFEDSKTDRSAQLPSLVSELKALGEGVILDGDLGAVGADGRPIPRKDLAPLGHDFKVPESGKAEFGGKPTTLRVRVFDCLYWEGQDLHAEPWERRRKALEAVFASADFRFLVLGDKRIVRTEQAFKAAWRELSRRPLSEGIVAKVTDSDYPLTGKSPGWAKVKDALEVKVEVLAVERKKGGGFVYDVGVRGKGGRILPAGKTLATSVEAGKGAILTLAAQEVIPKDGGVSFIVPKVVDLSSQQQAETAESILSRAEKFGVLQKAAVPHAGPMAEIAKDPTAHGWCDDNLAFDWWLRSALSWFPTMKDVTDPRARQYWRDYWTRQVQLGAQVPADLPKWAHPAAEGLTAAEAQAFQVRWAETTAEASRAWRTIGSPDTGALLQVLGAYGADPTSDVWDCIRDAARAGGLSFKEGDEGVGIFQTHERGLTELQAKQDQAFGWDPVEVGEADLARLEALAPGDWAEALEAAAQGSSKRLATLAREANRNVQTAEDRRVVALVDPVSVHLDMRLHRLAPTKDNHWEGGEMFTPGNQFRPNKFRQIAEGDLDPSKKVLMNFKVSRVGEGEPSDKQPSGEEVIRGPLTWMTIGDKGPEVFEPGLPGSTSGAWSRFRIHRKFKWRAGRQDPHFKEFWLEDAGEFTGRWQFQFVPTAAGRQWMVSRPKEQVRKAWMTIAKRDTDRRLVTGAVLVPGKVDLQGDVMTAEVIEQVAYQFLAEYNRSTSLGIQHALFPPYLLLRESWLLKEPWFHYPVGTWMLTTQVMDDQKWEDVKQGALRGFSIGGTGRGRRL